MKKSFQELKYMTALPSCGSLIGVKNPNSELSQLNEDGRDVS
jgi:hypothetical protein